MESFDCTITFDLINDTIGSKVVNTIPLKHEVSPLVSFLVRWESRFLWDKILILQEGGNLVLSSKYGIVVLKP